MAMLHILVGKIIRGTSAGGSTGFAQYIAREHVTHTTQHARYLRREGGQEVSDLVVAGAEHLPPWAPTDVAFWRVADTYERQGGIVARTWEIALPRELSPDQRRELADDIRAVHFGPHVHSWAIHNPRTRDGQHEQPHLHVMVSERVLDGYDRAPKVFFSRAAAQSADPGTGGARKDLRWNHRERLAAFRASVALLTNASLERHGHAVAVSAKTLKARGFARTPEREHTPAEKFLYAKKGIATAQWQQTLARRDDLQRHHHPWEQEMARAEWQQTRAQRGIRDCSRAAIRTYAMAAWDHRATPASEAPQVQRDSQVRQGQQDQQRPQGQRHQRDQQGHDGPTPSRDLAARRAPASGARAPGRHGVPREAFAGGMALRDALPGEAVPAGHSSGPDLQRVSRDDDREQRR